MIALIPAGVAFMMGEMLSIDSFAEMYIKPAQRTIARKQVKRMSIYAKSKKLRRHYRQLHKSMAA